MKSKKSDEYYFWKGAKSQIEYVKHIYDTHEELDTLDEFRPWLLNELRHCRETFKKLDKDNKNEQ